MRKLTIAILFLSLTANANADAQSFKQWWKHHHILCMCIGILPGPVGGN
jgi:hypothetical protein